MWLMIASLQPIVQALAPAFTLPSFHTHCQLVLGWVMCLGQHRLCRVADTAQPQDLRDHSRHHGLDTTYNFFAHSAWTVTGLAYHVAVLILTRLHLGGTITLLVDDTLAHKRGKHVWGLGWFRDAVASTRKRTATAAGHNWVVVAVAVCLPFANAPILALPLLARLHRPGQAQPSCPLLARAARRSAGLVPRPALYPGGRRRLRGPSAAGGPGRARDLRRPVARRRGRVRPASASGQARPARPRGEEGAASAQPQSSRRQGRP